MAAVVVEVMLKLVQAFSPLIFKQAQPVDLVAVVGMVVVLVVLELRDKEIMVALALETVLLLPIVVAVVEVQALLVQLVVVV
jgi:hypothetical protein